MNTEIAASVTDGNLYDMEDMLSSALSAGENPKDLLEAMMAGLKTCGDHFEAGEYFMPELMGAGETQLRGRKLSSGDNFQRGIDLFQTGDFQAARELFAAVSVELPEDRAAALYIKRCDEYLRHPPAPTWDGALDLDTK